MRLRDRNPQIRQASQARWREWCEETKRRAYLRQFAEAWVGLMESRARQERAQVRNTAEATMQQAQATGRQLTEQQIREVILILHDVWYLGTSLYHWGKEQGILRPND